MHALTGFLSLAVDETTTDIICIKCKKDDSNTPNEIVLCDACGIGGCGPMSIVCVLFCSMYALGPSGACVSRCPLDQRQWNV